MFGVGRERNQIRTWEEKSIEYFIKVLTPDLEIKKIGKLLGVFNRIHDRLSENYKKAIYTQIIKMTMALNEPEKQKLVFEFLEFMFKKHEEVSKDVVKRLVEYLISNLTQTKNLSLFDVRIS